MIRSLERRHHFATGGESHRPGDVVLALGGFGEDVAGASLEEKVDGRGKRRSRCERPGARTWAERFEDRAERQDRLDHPEAIDAAGRSGATRCGARIVSDRDFPFVGGRDDRKFTLLRAPMHRGRDGVRSSAGSWSPRPGSRSSTGRGLTGDHEVFDADRGAMAPEADRGENELGTTRTPRGRPVAGTRAEGRFSDRFRRRFFVEEAAVEIAALGSVDLPGRWFSTHR